LFLLLTKVRVSRIGQSLAAAALNDARREHALRI